MQDIVLIALYWAAPVILVFVLVIWANRSARDLPMGAIFHYRFGASRIALTSGARRAAAISIGTIFLLSWYLNFILPFADLLIYTTILFYLRTNLPRREVRLQQATNELLEGLPRLSAADPSLAPQVATLQTEIALRQGEIEDRQREAKDLEDLLAQRQSEFASLNALTAEQREDAYRLAREALGRRSIWQALGVIVGSVVLNLVATVLWTLAGEPGRDVLLSPLRALVVHFGIGNTP